MWIKLGDEIADCHRAALLPAKKVDGRMSVIGTVAAPTTGRYSY